MPGMLQPEMRVTRLDPNVVSVTVKSFFTHTDHTMTLHITQDQWDRWQGGEYIQTALPHLSADQREFLMSGATPEEWEKEFGDDE